jgi:hypothetical protein
MELFVHTHNDGRVTTPPHGGPRGLRCMKITTFKVIGFSTIAVGASILRKIDLERENPLDFFPHFFSNLNLYVFFKREPLELLYMREPLELLI